MDKEETKKQICSIMKTLNCIDQQVIQVKLQLNELRLKLLKNG